LGYRGSHTCLRGRGWGEPVPTKGQKLGYSCTVNFNPSRVEMVPATLRNKMFST
jgi:hypothetical protein